MQCKFPDSDHDLKFKLIFNTNAFSSELQFFLEFMTHKMLINTTDFRRRCWE